MIFGLLLISQLNKISRHDCLEYMCSLLFIRVRSKGFKHNGEENIRPNSFIKVTTVLDDLCILIPRKRSVKYQMKLCGLLSSLFIKSIQLKLLSQFALSTASPRSNISLLDL